MRSDRQGPWSSRYFAIEGVGHLEHIPAPVEVDRERAAFALTEAVTLIAGSDVDAAYEAAAEHFQTDELAALLYAIVTINGWNRLAIATHMVFEP